MNTSEEHRAAMLQQAVDVRDRYQTFTAAARTILDDQPSAATVRAAARQMTAVITAMAEEIAEGRPC